MFEGITGEEVQKRLHHSKGHGRGVWSSVDRAVKRLVTHGLAIHSKSEGLYYAEPVNESQLLNLSVKLETNGRAEMQRIRHNIDREIFLNQNMNKAMRPYNDVMGKKR